MMTHIAQNFGKLGIQDDDDDEGVRCVWASKTLTSTINLKLLLLLTNHLHKTFLIDVRRTLLATIGHDVSDQNLYFKTVGPTSQHNIVHLSSCYIFISQD